MTASAVVSIVALASCSSGGGKSGGTGSTGTGAARSNKKVHGLTPDQAAQTLIKIGNTTITVGEFAERLASQSPYLRARYNSPERRQEFLDNVVRFELLADEAHRRGLDKVAEVEHVRKQMMIQEMMKREFEDRIRIEDIPDADVRSYYDQHRDEFNKPEQVRASHILIRDQAKAQRVLNELLARATDINFFRQVAEQNNEDAATRETYGDLRFFSRPSERQPDEPEVPAQLAEAAFAITQIGGMSRTLIRTPEGFHIVKLTARRPALHRTLDEARRPIQNKLWRERRERAVEELVSRLRRDANVQVDERLVQQVRVEVPEGTTSPTTAPLPTPAANGALVPPPSNVPSPPAAPAHPAAPSGSQ